MMTAVKQRIIFRSKKENHHEGVPAIKQVLPAAKQKKYG